MVSYNEQDDTTDDNFAVSPESSPTSVTEEAMAETATKTIKADAAHRIAAVIPAAPPLPALVDATNYTNHAGPNGYAAVRKEAEEFQQQFPKQYCDGTNTAAKFMRVVENRPYLPLLKVDITSDVSVIRAAKAILDIRAFRSSRSSNGILGSDVVDSDDEDECDGKVTRISGGLTNALFLVEVSSACETSVLVRVFGAEGMIDRDEETTNLARLCDASPDGVNDDHDCKDPVIHTKIDVLGRFCNGRIESWIPNLRQAHHLNDFRSRSNRDQGCSVGGVVLEVARQLARLHYGFDVPDYLLGQYEEGVERSLSNHSGQRPHPLQPTLWSVINSWIDELSRALSHEKFEKNAALLDLFHDATIGTITMKRTTSGGNYDAVRDDNRDDYGSGKANDVLGDTIMAAKEIVSFLSDELKWLQSLITTKFPNAPVAFCHNDVNAANILLDASIDIDANNGNNVSLDSFNENTVCIIDFEYGSINYTMFDVANFFNEHCGGLEDGIPNYDLYPSLEGQLAFLEEYIRKRDEILIRESCEDSSSGEMNGNELNGKYSVSNLQRQVDLFQLANNLYWGVWGIAQASNEVAVETFRMEDAKLRLDGKAGLDAFDNLRYGKNRLKRYRICKERMLEKT